MVNAWHMRTELGIEIVHRIYMYLVQKYPLGFIYLDLFFSAVKKNNQQQA